MIFLSLLGAGLLVAFAIQAFRAWRQGDLFDTYRVWDNR